MTKLVEDEAGDGHSKRMLKHDEDEAQRHAKNLCVHNNVDPLDTDLSSDGEINSDDDIIENSAEYFCATPAKGPTV